MNVTMTEKSVSIPETNDNNLTLIFDVFHKII